MEGENDSVHCQRLSCKEESPVAIMVTSVALKPRMLKLNVRIATLCLLYYISGYVDRVVFLTTEGRR